ncbi:MAG: hypothetical protein WD749_14415 [Phycisphaerales bacterium]
MTLRDDPDDIVVTRSRPVWWFRNDISWPAIIAGAATALALFAVAGLLARAIGLGWTYRATVTSGEQAGAVIWGGLAALVCFGLGGFVAAKLAPRENGAFNGFLVWAVCTPLLMFWVGTSLNPLVTPAPAEATTAASGRIYGTAAPLFQESGRDGAYRDEFRARQPPMGSDRETAQTAAWWSLVSLAMGLVGAAGAGALTSAAERDRVHARDWKDRDREGTRGPGCAP